MVYATNAKLRFATAATRTTAAASVTSSIGARAVTVSSSSLLLPDGVYGLTYSIRGSSAIDIQAIYTAITILVAVQPGSTASWHACYHGDLAQLCALTGSKVW